MNVTQAPLAITMQGSDSGSGAFGLTSYTTVSRSNGFLSFDWDYTTSDSLPVWDPFYFLLNGTLTALAEAFGPVDQSASFSSPVAEGDIFGFVIETDDDAFGPASVTITNFHAPSSKPIDVPEPASLLGLLAVLSAGAVLHRRPERSS
ncbi:PEP-CTERM sorting domain-containing protein [Romeria aff. gracilis LEGE 07310]|uniref:PEP-CTERM sorting domain-containing protein n=1 Tax=Vasconcelosia minhoensis LEGE 07310 TaxID=915328 RepID=A0A8J7AT86_9CYAN|nr:PEP-CTERM sorting domain-containing protein [Romeria aff. gracilis LEGE 07310]